MLRGGVEETEFDDWACMGRATVGQCLKSARQDVTGITAVVLPTEKFLQRIDPHRQGSGLDAEDLPGGKRSHSAVMMSRRDDSDDNGVRKSQRDNAGNGGKKRRLESEN